MHNEKPTIEGFGNLVWDQKSLVGREKLDIVQIWKKENDFYLDTLDKLNKSQLTFDRKKVNERIHSIINNRRKQIQKNSLVNQDVTPENIICNDVIAFLESKSESMDVTFEERLQHNEKWFKGITVSKEEQYANLGRMLNNIENEDQKEEFKSRIEAVIN